MSSARKQGLFLAVKDKMIALARKRGVFMAAERADKKETPSKLQRKSPAVSRANSLLATSETNLFVERSSNVNSACNCTTYHRVVTDAEESHHLNVCWN